MKRDRLAVALALIALISVNLYAQNQHKNQERGFSANSAYASQEIDHINLFNGNLVLTIPIGSRYPVGGQLSYSMTLFYNSNSWTQREVCLSQADVSTEFYSTWFLTVDGEGNGVPGPHDPIIESGDPWDPSNDRTSNNDCFTINEPSAATNAGLGWQLTMGKLYKPRKNPFEDRPEKTEKSLWVYMSPDGSEHTFYGKLHEDDPSDSPDYWYTRDGSYLRMRTNLSNTNGNMQIEFPSGEKHYFKEILIRRGVPAQNIPDEYEEKPTRIEDQFGNWVNILYKDSATDNNDLPDDEWEITDSLNRTQTVKFQEVVSGYQKVVTSVFLTAFGNGSDGSPRRSEYTFSYDAKRILRPGPHVPPNTIAGYDDYIDAPFLTAVGLPDKSQYAMPVNAAPTAPSYDIQDTARANNGMIQKLILPTGGQLEWKYKLDNVTSDPYRYSYALGSAARQYNRASMGVRRRILTEKKNGVYKSYTWKYDPRIGPLPSGCTLSSSLSPPCGPSEFINRVTTPEGDYTNYYFSAYPFPYDSYSGTAAGRNIAEPHVADYALPFTKDTADSNKRKLDVFGKPLFLSTEIYNSRNFKLRSTYVRYETDLYVGSDGWGSAVDSNARLAASRTVYHDDEGRYTEEQYYNFDGLGHYRTTEYFGNLGSGDRRIEVIRYNPDRGVYNVDPATNRPDTSNQNANFKHTYTPFPEARPWVLGTYDMVIAGDFSQRSTTYFNFDQRGQLLAKRIRKELEKASSAYLLGAQDVLINYAYTAQGNLFTESYYGGEKQAGLNTAVTFPQPATHEYKITYGYPQCGGSSLGVIRVRQFAGSDYKVTDNDVDCNTGLIKASRDTAGNQTDYVYDPAGRLTNIYTAQGSATQIRYNPVESGSTSESPTVNVFHRANRNSTSPILDEEEYGYDQLGRLVTEKVKMPDGSFSFRFTEYNGQGWKTSLSEWIPAQTNTDNKKTIYDNFDPFGRPGRTTLPDGKRVLQQFSGIRQIYRQISVGNQVSLGTVNETDAVKYERYDRFGKLYQVEEQSGANDQLVTTSYGHNVLNKLTVACMASAGISQCRSFTYDNTGSLRTEGHPERGWAQYDEYDTLGNRGKSYDGVHWLRYAYDPSGRPTSVTELYEATWQWRPVKELTYYCSSTTASYCTAETAGGAFAHGKLATSSRHNYVTNPYTPTVTQDVDVIVTEKYVYNGLDGRLSQRDTSTNTGSAFTQSFGYDQLGDLAWQTYPNCLNQTCTDSAGANRPWRVNYFNQNGELTSVGGGPGNSTTSNNYASSITYNPNQTTNTVAHSNGITDVYSMDPNYMPRVARIWAQNGSGYRLWDSGAGNDPAQVNYKYDGGGNVIKIGRDWYVYDKANRLVEGTALSTGRKQRYTYDAFGNQLTIDTYANVTPSSATLIEPFQSNVNSAKNQYNGMEYDGAGNMLGLVNNRLYTYDSLNMIKYAPGFTYLYGPNDERIWKVDRGQSGSTIYETFTLRGLNNEVLREYKLTGGNYAGNWRWMKDYIYRGDKLLATESAAGQRHYHLDHLGTARLVTDGGAVVRESPQYFPFGAEATAPAPSSQEPDPLRLRFTGHERDKDYAGQVLDYMHSRYYRAGFAKFLSLDPKGQYEASAQPQVWNRYTYVLNNPLKLIDPDGRSPIMLNTSNQKMMGMLIRTAMRPSGREILSKIVETKAQVQIIDGIVPNNGKDVTFGRTTLSVDSIAGKVAGVSTATIIDTPDICNSFIKGQVIGHPKDMSGLWTFGHELKHIFDGIQGAQDAVDKKRDPVKEGDDNGSADAFGEKLTNEHPDKTWDEARDWIFSGNIVETGQTKSP
ncbi:MAG TPA: RHS repeat-associated core domain-containing protein [Pyrinomonadaceae bacterium]|jgi:RHS repeat-associated protein|nr:RHS repeat-associated core domain-containing protein [Pyrinomonadaceae bacterium]